MNKRGFTLIETVLAIVVGALIFYSLLLIFINSPLKSNRLDNLNTGVYLAKSKMETFTGKKFSTITSEATQAFSGNFSGYSSVVAVNSVASTELNTPVAYGSTNYKKIDVVVNLPSATGGSVSLSTVVTDVSNQ